jgi:hypothetical protein
MAFMWSATKTGLVTQALSDETSAELIDTARAS